MKLAMLAFLYCREIVKNSIEHVMRHEARTLKLNSSEMYPFLSGGSTLDLKPKADVTKSP